MSEQKNKLLAGMKATWTLIAIIIVMAASIGIVVALKLGFMITKIAIIALVVILAGYLTWDHLRLWYLRKIEDEEQKGGKE